jgi:hypothetical protein
VITCAQRQHPQLRRQQDQYYVLGIVEIQYYIDIVTTVVTKLCMYIELKSY